uniref:Uncharacterized protein n=1 Tax=Helianthus annuus TaxID=4232 RepID=A0A251S3L4_HELAN
MVMLDPKNVFDLCVCSPSSFSILHCLNNGDSTSISDSNGGKPALDSSSDEKATAKNIECLIIHNHFEEGWMVSRPPLKRTWMMYEVPNFEA